MSEIEKRLLKLEVRQGSGSRHLKALLHLAPEKLTDRELMAVIQGCEPWKLTRDLTGGELTTIAGGN